MFSISPNTVINFTSPKYPAQYNDNERVCWILNLTNGANTIRWYFEDFDTEQCCDCLSLYAPPDDSGKPIEKYLKVT